MAGVMNLPKGKNDRNTKCTGPVCIPYSNQEAVRNLVSYVTGTGSRADKGEVIWYETFGLDPNTQLAIMQIEKTQEIFGLDQAVRYPNRNYILSKRISQCCCNP